VKKGSGRGVTEHTVPAQRHVLQTEVWTSLFDAAYGQIHWRAVRMSTTAPAWPSHKSTGWRRADWHFLTHHSILHKIGIKWIAPLVQMKQFVTYLSFLIDEHTEVGLPHLQHTSLCSSQIVKMSGRLLLMHGSSFIQNTSCVLCTHSLQSSQRKKLGTVTSGGRTDHGNPIHAFRHSITRCMLQWSVVTE
jgi:hypothetical protein